MASGDTSPLLLERTLMAAKEYRVPPRWIAFGFAVFTIFFAGVLCILLGSWMLLLGLYVVPIIVLANLAVLYIWLVATGRTDFAVKSARQVGRDLPRLLLGAMGLTLVAGAVICAVAEIALKAATGSDNEASSHFSTLVPLLLVCGVLDLVLAGSRPSASRPLAWLVLASNSAVGAWVASSVYEEDFFLGGNEHFQVNADSKGSKGGNGLGYGFDSYGPPADRPDSDAVYTAYAEDRGFFASWMEGRDASSFPPAHLNSLLVARSLPLGVCAALPVITALVLLRALFSVSALARDPAGRGSYLVAALGGLLLLTSFFLVCSVTRLTTVVLKVDLGDVSSCAWLFLVSTLAGLLGLSQARGSSASSRVALMALAAVTFVYSYQVVSDVAGRVGSTNRAAYGELRENVFCQSSDNSSSSEVCFRVAGGGREGLAESCVRAEDICNGVADVASPAYRCDQAAAEEGKSVEAAGYAFADEMGCPGHVGPVLAELRAASGAAAALSLLLLLSVGLQSWGRKDKEGAGEKEGEERERSLGRDLWRRVMASASKKTAGAGEGGEKDDRGSEC